MNNRTIICYAISLTKKKIVVLWFQIDIMICASRETMRIYIYCLFKTCQRRGSVKIIG